MCADAGHGLVVEWAASSVLVLVEEEEIATPIEPSITETPRGVSFIVHIQNDSAWRKARISQATIKGIVRQPRCYQPPDHSYLFDSKILEEEMKWYQKLSVDSDIYEGMNDFPVIEPKTKAWLKLDFLYPSILNTGWVEGEECCREGSDSCKERSFVTWEDFFRMTVRDSDTLYLTPKGVEKGPVIRAGSDFGLRDEWKDRELHFTIQTIPVVPIHGWGQNSFEIGYEKILLPIKVNKQEWLDLSARELVLRPNM